MPVSVIDVYKRQYATIGQGIKKILEEYAKEFFKNGKAKGKNWKLKGERENFQILIK